MKQLFSKTQNHIATLTAALVASAVFMSAHAQDRSAAIATQEPAPGDLVAWVELVRSDIKTEKALIIAKNIQFTEAEAVEFWPLHREYNLELNKLLDQRLYLLNHYMGIYDSMTDRQASDLAKRSFDLEEKRTKLKRRYFKRFAKVVPSKKAAQFFQIENQINAVLDVRLAAALPLIK